jgi:hypothetical protein
LPWANVSFVLRSINPMQITPKAKVTSAYRSSARSALRLARVVELTEARSEREAIDVLARPGYAGYRCHPVPP